MKHLLQLSTLSENEIMNILEVANECEKGEHLNEAKGKVVANMFFEPSTRTQYSFNTAEVKLGCDVLTFNAEASSMQKGETFYDTIKTFESFGVDALVIRSSIDEYYQDLVNKIEVPILNAGDGVKDHPTQSLLDLMTIYQEYNRFKGLKIAIVGDIVHSRVAKTNIEVMERLGMEVYISGPEEFRANGYSFIPFFEAIKEMDVIMLLRIQHERHKGKMEMSLEQYHQEYGLTMDLVNRMKETAIIMHPAPFNRNVEIADDVVECSKSRIFKQIKNGVYIRMAVLLRAFEGVK